MLQSVKLNTTWPGGTPRPSPAALPRISTVSRRVNKPLFQCQIKRKFKNKGVTKDTVQFFYTMQPANSKVDGSSRQPKTITEVNNRTQSPKQ